MHPIGSSVTRILLLEDNTYVADAMLHLLFGLADVVHTPTVAVARSRLASESWDAIIADQRLPDGNGLDVIATARLPGLLVTAYADAAVINRAAALHVPIIIKPDISSLVMRWVGSLTNPETWLDDAVDDCASSCGLTAAERCIMRLSASGLTNAEIAQERNVSQHTVRNEVKSLLAKTGDHSLRDAVIRMLNRACSSRARITVVFRGLGGRS